MSLHSDEAHTALVSEKHFSCAALHGLAGLIGLGTTNPRQMGANDIMRVIDYARRERPEALRTAVQEQPWLAKALGNPLVMSALATVATRLVSRGLKNFDRWRVATSGLATRKRPNGSTFGHLNIAARSA
jgi:hypothetical protein